MNLASHSERLLAIAPVPQMRACLVTDNHPGMALEWLESLEPSVRARTVVATRNPCPEYAADLWDAGLGGLIVGSEPEFVIECVLEAVSAGGRVREPGPIRSELIPSERAILRFLPRGDCNKRIALRLGLSERTVRNRLVDIAEKLGLNNRTQIAMYYAGQWQWLERYRALLERFWADAHWNASMGTVSSGAGKTVRNGLFAYDFEPVALASD